MYQSLKLDDARVAKVKVDDFEPYWKFLSNTNVDVIDQDTLAKCTDYAEIIAPHTLMAEKGKLCKNENRSIFHSWDFHNNTAYHMDAEKFGQYLKENIHNK